MESRLAFERHRHAQRRRIQSDQEGEKAQVEPSENNSGDCTDSLCDRRGPIDGFGGRIPDASGKTRRTRQPARANRERTRRRDPYIWPSLKFLSTRAREGCRSFLMAFASI